MPSPMGDEQSGIAEKQFRTAIAFSLISEYNINCKIIHNGEDAR